jgi:hypothetical protein
MKEMKNIYSKLALVLIAFALTLACTSDDYTDASTQTAANSTLSVTLDFPSSQTFVEREETYPFTVTLSEPQIVDVVVYLSASGTATEGEDFAFPHSLRMPAGSTSISDVITIHRDVDPEDTETVVINIGTGFEANVSSINGATASFTLQDYVFCTWTLETSDTYGDGWNGGYIEVTTEGVTTDYHEAADGPTIFEIIITDGADFSFTYVSGGGGFCGGPGYECENYFKLTSPDGTVWEEGAMDYSDAPTEGVITSGTNSCP